MNNDVYYLSVPNCSVKYKGGSTSGLITVHFFTGTLKLLNLKSLVKLFEEFDIWDIMYGIFRKVSFLNDHSNPRKFKTTVLNIYATTDILDRDKVVIIFCIFHMFVRC